jgi:LacI family transcriptional regulator
LTDEPSPGWERRSLSRLAGTLIDGAIVVTPSALLPDASIPVVAIDPHAGRGGPATVDSDNRGGAKLATEYLIGLGHRRIAHIRGRVDLESTRQREQGYRSALKAAGIPFDPGIVSAGEYRMQEGASAARELLTGENRPTAIFAANDLSAIGALATARELGFRVPEDLSVMGYDDIPDAAAADPPLSTVAQPLATMGATALRVLIKLLSGAEGQRHLKLKTKLIVRDTTGPAPASNGGQLEQTAVTSPTLP